MQQSRRHPHRHLDQGTDRDPQIRRPLHDRRSRPLARRRKPRVRGGSRAAQGLAADRLQRRHPYPRGPLEDQGIARRHPGRLLVADSPQGRNPHQTLGRLPRRFALGPVGLHRARPVRLRRRSGHLLLREVVLHKHREGRRPLSRMDGRRNGPLSAQIRPLRGHRLHEPRHCHGPLHRRQPPAPLQRPDEIQRRRAGPPVQCDGQALAREDRRGQPRRLPHRQRHHGQRVQVPARPRSGRHYAQRLRKRLRMDRRGVLHQARRGATSHDRRGRGLSGQQVRKRPADHRHQRPLRIPQQGHRRLPRVAQAARRIGQTRARGARLHHRAGRQPRPPRRPAGPPCRPRAADRPEPVPLHDPLPREPRLGSDRQFDQRQHPGTPGLEGEGDLRADLPQQDRRHLQQGLLRTARRHGRHGLRLLLRAVGIHPAGIGGLLRPDDHHDPRRIRSLGGQAPRTRRRGSCPPRRFQRPGGTGEDLRRPAAILRTGQPPHQRGARIGIRPLDDGPLGAPLLGLRAGLLRGGRKFDRPHQPRRTRRRRRQDRTDQLRASAALRRETQLEPHDGGQDASEAAARPRGALAQPLVVLEPRGPRPVRRHRPRAVGRIGAQPDRVPRPAERRAAQGARTRRQLPRTA